MWTFEGTIDFGGSKHRGFDFDFLVPKIWTVFIGLTELHNHPRTISRTPADEIALPLTLITASDRRPVRLPLSPPVPRVVQCPCAPLMPTLL